MTEVLNVYVMRVVTTVGYIDDGDTLLLVTSTYQACSGHGIIVYQQRFE